MTNNQKDMIDVNKYLYLAPANNQYASDIYNIITGNREYFSQFMAWPKFVKNQADTAQFLDSCWLKHQQNESKTYVILLKGQAIGLLSFNQIDKNNKTAYIGYWLDRSKQGNGIMTVAINALIKHYAMQKIIRRFVIKCAVNNEKSNAIAKRCGFSYEGTLKQAEYINGTFHDQNIYGLIAN
ncbi:50S ribosomal protein L7/L12-serine acetyltransferase [Gilliamella apicola]|uniref:50S ribosomal protein L7/L12-serine acetyltransferase n=1 Tax=Gilliamella apicola TaxID=1196095 RepID=A0A556RP07_9GAMM|nr:50S ribosomal protein L7/L12-serine acetyltransferase [Gilliamella apicola]TSJ90647.1 50S ribosomal protein L7/L12-serine acetyltransferase [Gilliamella apicola]